MAGFRKFAMHVTDDAGKEALPKLRNERVGHSSFAAGAAIDQKDLDPETAAKRIMEQALASKSVKAFTAPAASGKEPEFRSLGTETVPLTGTTIVKFRQYFDKVPVYSSLVTVELDDHNECVSLNSNIAQPKTVDTVAKISPAQALRTAAKAAGYGAKPIDAICQLQIYNDTDGTWRLVYIVEDVPTKAAPGERKGKKVSQRPLIMDFVIDAKSGKLIANLPRTPSAKHVLSATDELGKTRKINVTAQTPSKHILIDETLGVETYDFAFDDPDVNSKKLPGKIIANPPVPSPAAVSAHANAAVVASFLQDTLKRNNIDNQGGRLVSTVNCVVVSESDDAKQWFNAFWEGKQMVYGQVDFGGKLRSLAASLDVVGHEMFHGVTDKTCKLEYALESGALNESYSDVFGAIISNFELADIGAWNWECGDGISSSEKAFRDLSDPTRFGDPKHMKDFVKKPNTRNGDYGGVHTNSGIHNYATYCVMTSKDAGGKYLFTPQQLAAMFYICLTQHLSRQSKFKDSRTGTILAARSLFRNLPSAQLEARIKAVEDGFAAAGIT
jgi:Zn-dependent metalloprotease